jgi:outer membrane protein OmpA-like peptidoglycan-associated protein
MTSGVLPENLRGLSPGAGGRLTLGVPLRPRAAVEVSLLGFRAAGEEGLPPERTLGAGLDLRLESLGEQVTTLFLAGGGYSQTRRAEERISAPFANIGWGLEYDVGRFIAVRGDARGVVRFADGFIEGRGVTYDAVLSLGLTYRFGAGSERRRSASSQEMATSAATTFPPAAATAMPPMVAQPSLPVADDSAPVLSPPETLQVPAIVDAPNCPPPQVNAQLDATGCLLPQRFTVPRAQFFDGLTTSVLEPTAEPLLLALTSVLRRNPGMQLEVAVHTDSEGFADDNLQATAALAVLLKQRLVSLGADPSRVESKGMGEQSPAANEDSAVGIEKNRRVVFTLSAP